MLQIGFIRANPEEVIDRLKIKNFDAATIVAQILSTDEKRRKAQILLDQALSEANKISKSIGQFFKESRMDEATAMKAQTAELKIRTKSIGEELEKYTSALLELINQLPNLPHTTVPTGKSSDDNVIISQEGEVVERDDHTLPHWALARKYNIIDFELGNKVTGAGFPFYRGKGARLQRALINFFLKEGTNAGYEEFQPPLLVNVDSAYGTGNFPDKDSQMYATPLDNLYLIPTAEVPITNIYRNVILKEDDFPVKNVAYSCCFRREAGSWGAQVRGLNRLHQFDKVEIVQIRKPEESYRALKEMREYVASILRKLELPFRIAKLCGSDISFTSALTYDFEVFSSAQKRWLEVSSVSNFEDFQANRMKLRYKSKAGKTIVAHTLNGSALALPRIVAALLENNQTEEGIKIPEALVPYTEFGFID